MALTQIADAGLKTPSSDLQDNEKIVLGTGNDLEIYHDGSNSYVAETGTGALVLGGGSVGIMNAAGTENNIWCTENGSVSLYYDNAKKLETTSTGATLSSTNPFLEISGTAASSGDTGIFLNANANHWVVKADNYTSGNQFQIKHGDTSSSETAIACVQNGSVELYYDGTKKFETVSGGAVVTGNPVSYTHLTLPTKA